RADRPAARRRPGRARGVRGDAGDVRTGRGARGRHAGAGGVARSGHRTRCPGPAPHGLEHGPGGRRVAAVPRHRARALLLRALVRGPAVDARRAAAVPAAGPDLVRLRHAVPGGGRERAARGDAVPSREVRGCRHPPARQLDRCAGPGYDLDLVPMSDFSATPELVLLPAVDVAGGKAVRLTQGEAGSETHYGDPVDAALEWARQGAEWIHLVDLDAAFGRGTNTAVLRKVIKHVRGVKIELSGGIRDDATLEAALESGATRINLGTAALENPEWAAAVIGRYGDAIAVGLDVRGTTLAARGWTREGGDLWTVLDRLESAGCSRYVVTDVTKDGTL